MKNKVGNIVLSERYRHIVGTKTIHIKNRKNKNKQPKKKQKE